MSVRDQLRLAIEMQNGIVDRFVAARMRKVDGWRKHRTDDKLLAIWLRFGEPFPLNSEWFDVTASPVPRRFVPDSNSVR